MLATDTFVEMAADHHRTLRRIGQVSILSLSTDQACDMIHAAIQGRQHLKLAFANSHVVNVAATQTGFAKALQAFAVLPDGIGVDLGSRLLYGAPFAANLNGTDFLPRLIISAPAPLRIGLIGARPGVAERAVLKLEALAPQHQYRVFGDGFFSADDEAGLLTRLAADPPDLLLVAFGNPRQEIWIADKLGREHCAVAVGVGALFDFLAGEVVRAPVWLQRLRLEWVFRLAQEPARLWRRYVLGNPAFLIRVVMQKLRDTP